MSTATQRSLITPTRISASGRLDNEAMGGGVIIGAEAQSGMNVTFDLAVPHRYDLHAAVETFRGDTFAFQEFAIGLAGVRALTSQGLGGELNAVGILPAGRHEFLLEALSFVEAVPGDRLSAAATYQADLQLTPVPEPSTILLVGAGSALLARYRRKKVR
jgi:hypothetical protein